MQPFFYWYWEVPCHIFDEGYDQEIFYAVHRNTILTRVTTRLPELLRCLKCASLFYLSWDWQTWIANVGKIETHASIYFIPGHIDPVLTLPVSEYMRAQFNIHFTVEHDSIHSVIYMIHIFSIFNAHAMLLICQLKVCRICTKFNVSSPLSVYSCG